MRYPLDITPSKDGTLRVAIRDLQGAVTACDDLDHLSEMAMDAFRTAAENYTSNGKPIPTPTKVGRTERYLELPISLAAKVLLLNEMREKNVRPSDLAKLMGKSPQNVNRLVKLHTSTKVEQVDLALRALGKSLQLTVRPVSHESNPTTQ